MMDNSTSRDLPEFTRQWDWNPEPPARGSSDLSPGCELWLAVGDEPPQRVRVLRWLQHRDRLCLAVRPADGPDVVVDRFGPWFDEGMGPVAEIMHGDHVQVLLLAGDAVGRSLARGHIWPPDATPPSGPPERGRGRRA